MANNKDYTIMITITWVMLVMSTYIDGSYVEAVQFQDKQACIEASKVILAATKNKKAGYSINRYIHVKCVATKTLDAQQ